MIILYRRMQNILINKITDVICTSRMRCPTFSRPSRAAKLLVVTYDKTDICHIQFSS